jgi:predicted nucleic acid-binding protein
MTRDGFDTLICVIDTGVIIDFLRGRASAAALFRSLVREGDLAISTISQTEIFAAAAPETREVTARVLDAFTSIDVTPSIARRAAMLLEQRRARNETPDVADATIAATALELDLPLVTNELDRYRFANLHLVYGRAASPNGATNTAPEPAR